MDLNQETVIQKMLTVNTDPITNKSTIIQKDNQVVLVKKRLWSQGEV